VVSHIDVEKSRRKKNKKKKENKSEDEKDKEKSTEHGRPVSESSSTQPHMPTCTLPTTLGMTTHRNCHEKATHKQHHCISNQHQHGDNLVCVWKRVCATNSERSSDAERKAQQATHNTTHEAKHQGTRHHLSSHSTQQRHRRAASPERRKTRPVLHSSWGKDASEPAAPQTTKQQHQQPPPAEPNDKHHPKAQHAPHTCLLYHHGSQAQARDGDTNP
jgi:hypothetical protein